MKILKRPTKKRRVRQRRQLRWRRDVYMKICMLDWKKKGQKELFRLARQRDKAGKDVQHVRILKNENGNMMVSSEAVLKRWKEYFEKLINEENYRVSWTQKAEVVNKKVNCVSEKKSRMH